MNLLNVASPMLGLTPDKFGCICPYTKFSLKVFKP